MDIKIIGMTDQQEAYVGSNSRKFRINEFLIIEDLGQGDILGEIVEVHTYNKFIPMNNNGEIIDGNMINNLNLLGFNVEEGTIYFAKIRLLQEANYPIETGSDCRIPKFKEVKKYFISNELNKGLNIGVIRNTDDIYENIDEEYRDLSLTLEDKELKKQTEVPYILNLYDMHEYPHVGIFGGSGSGKSFGLRVVLEELMNKNIPTLVLDPHYEMDFSEKLKQDYGRDYTNLFSKFVIGENIGIDFKKISSKDLKNLLQTSSRLTEAMENVVDNLHKPKDSLFSFEQRLERLKKGQEIGSEANIRRVMEEIEDSEERKYYKMILEDFRNLNDKCPPSSVSGVSWRFDRLKKLGIFEHDSLLAEEALKNCKLVVIQGSIKIIQVFSTFLVNSVYEKRRNYKDSIIKNNEEDYFPPFFIITDEAHNFAPQSKDGMSESPSKYILREIAQEGRKYGVFLILATQRPSLLDSTITAQLNTKFIFRTTRANDIQTIKEETDLSPEQTKRLPYLKTGDVFLSESAIGRTMYVRIRAAHTTTPHKENPFIELSNKYSVSNEDNFELVKDYLPIMSTNFYELTKEIQEDTGKVYSVDQLRNILDELVLKEKLEIKKTFLGDRYEEFGR
ncbi:ATP-binding protein [Miniphocaeibacter massiliensis]|uniref:ATP-binding protein n=1 Tax=Miniphocaeibacter massiliensis TaxID=2041841 RepID=UPI001F5DD5A0|nr:ATP-binding protein [Miniphocaeibacter massiliensis]